MAIHQLTQSQMMDEEFIQKLGALIRRLADETPAKRVPSRQECRFCEVSRVDCPERMGALGQLEETATKDF